MLLTLAVEELWARKERAPPNCGKLPGSQAKAYHCLSSPWDPWICWGLSSQSPRGASLGSGVGLS